MATDQEIRDAGFKYVPQQKYLLNPFELPENQEPVTNSGIVNTNAFTNMGGGSGGALKVGDPMMNFDNFYNYTGNKYMMNQDRPNLDSYSDNAQKTFLGMPSYRQQELTGPDMGEYIGTGTDVPLELTTAGRVQNTLGNVTGGIQDLMGKVGGLGPVSFLMNKMDRFGSLSPTDQEFIKMNMGYTGPTVFGSNDSGLSKDPFGLNTRSAFGNYAERVGVEYDKLGDMLGGKMSEKYGVEFDPETGTFVGKNAAYANKMNKMNLAKYNFYKQQTIRRDLDKKTAEENARREAERKAAAAAAAAAASKAESAKQYNPNVHGPTNYGLGGDGQQSYDSGQGFGTNATSGGPVSNRTGRGRTDYMDGGLADMLEIYD